MSWLDYGMFIQNICIAARAYGLDTCPQAAWGQMHKVISPILNIEDGLIKDNFKRGGVYEIMAFPNIVNITFCRGVGYAFDEEVFDDATHAISATKIRKKLRDEGKLN